MNTQNLFFPVYDVSGQLPQLLGNAFGATHENLLVTYAHVVEGSTAVAVLRRDCHILVGAMVKVPIPGLNIAFILPIERIWPKGRLPFLPIEVVRLGKDVYSFGRSTGFNPDSLSDANDLYLKGHLVRSAPQRRISGGGRSVNYQVLSTSFAAVGGVSGSPAMTYRNGPKCAGTIFGNDQTRVLAHEIYNYEENSKAQREMINRIVEFASLYISSVIHNFLVEEGVSDALYTVESHDP